MLIINCTGVLPNGHVQLRRGRQRHQGVRRAASQPQPRLRRAPPSLRRLHFHPGKQPLWPRFVSFFSVFHLLNFCLGGPIAVFGGKSGGRGGRFKYHENRESHIFARDWLLLLQFSEGQRSPLRGENCSTVGKSSILQNSLDHTIQIYLQIGKAYKLSKTAGPNWGLQDRFNFSYCTVIHESTNSSLILLNNSIKQNWVAQQVWSSRLRVEILYCLKMHCEYIISCFHK